MKAARVEFGAARLRRRCSRQRDIGCMAARVNLWACGGDAAAALGKLCAGSWLAGGAKAERGVAGFSAEGCGNRRIGVSISAVERLVFSLQTHYPPSRTSLGCRSAW